MTNATAVTFVDLVPLIRALGTGAFMDQLKTQKENLQDCLQAAESKSVLSQYWFYVNKLFYSEMVVHPD